MSKEKLKTIRIRKLEIRADLKISEAEFRKRYGSVLTEDEALDTMKKLGIEAEKKK